MSTPENTPPLRLHTCGDPSNYPELERWLDEHNARFCYRLRSTSPPNGDPAVEGWRVGAVIVLITFYPATSNCPRGGWDIYTACGANDITETLTDAEARIR